MSLVAVGVLEARSCGEKTQLCNGGSLHPGRRVCEPGAMTHTGFVRAPVIPGETTSILMFPSNWLF